MSSILSRAKIAYLKQGPIGIDNAVRQMNSVKEKIANW